MLDQLTSTLIQGAMYLILIGVPILVIAYFYRKAQEHRKIADWMDSNLLEKAA